MVLPGAHDLQLSSILIENSLWKSLANEWEGLNLNFYLFSDHLLHVNVLSALQGIHKITVQN